MASIQTNNQAGDQNPPGIIVIWTGFLADIPLGWVLCDGSLSTPDLRDRFTRSVPNAATNPGAVGGVATVTITTGNMSSHLHSGTGTSHNHTGRWTAENNGSEANEGLGGGDAIQSGVPQSSSVKIVNTVAGDGGGGAHNNIPQFYSVAYIQKV